MCVCKLLDPVASLQEIKRTEEPVEQHEFSVYKAQGPGSSRPNALGSLADTLRGRENSGGEPVD